MRSYSSLALMMCVALALAGGCKDRTAGADGSAVWPDFKTADLGRDGAAPDVADLAGAPDRPKTPDFSGAADLKKSPDKLVVDLAPPPGWKAVSASTTKDLHAVACAGGHVFAAGAGGTILHRGPAATTFAAQKSTTTDELYAISAAVDSAGTSYAVAAGKGYAIYETKDWGATWAAAPQCSAYVFDTFHSLHLSTPTMGLAAGFAVSNLGAGSKYYTGYSWVCASPTYVAEEFYDVYNLSQQGWLVGKTKGKVYYTSDGGVNWTSATTPTTETLRGVHFAGVALGLAVGEKGTLLRCTDSVGKAWSKVASPTTEDLRDVHFWDNKSGWAVGNKGTVLHSADGGKTWSAQASGTTKRLESVCFSSATEGWAVGEAGTILHTTTGGK